MEFSTSFVPPPAFLNVEYAFDFHQEKNPDHPALLHTLKDGDLRSYSYAEVVPAIHRAGRHICRNIGFEPTGTSTPPVMAILGPIDNFMFFTIIMGLLRAGITGFPVSPRFSTGVIAELVSSVNATHILVNEYNGSLGAEIASQILRSSGRAPSICIMPTYNELYLGNNEYDALPCHSNNECAFIVHSSSSTSHIPKTIYWSSNYIRRNALVADSSVYPLTGKVIGGQAIELFHTAGLLLVFRIARAGFVLATTTPGIPVYPGSEIIFQSICETKCTLIWASPRALEPWSEDPVKVKFLSMLTAVIYFGQPLTKPLGNKLVAAGVRISTDYGSTETGTLASMISNTQGSEWEYFTFNSTMHTKFIRNADNTLGIFVIAKSRAELPIINDEIDGEPAYATGDLAMAHPTKPGLYKILGRIHDQIMLSTGEFVNPLQIETLICGHAYVTAAFVFGHGKPCLGIIVQYNRKDNSHPVLKNEDLWSSISKETEHLPTYAQIPKHMIMIASAKKPFAFTPKGAIKRAMVLSDYQVEIQQLYSAHLGQVSVQSTESDNEM